MSDLTNQSSPSGNDILLIVLSVILPPLGVAVSNGIGKQFVINIVLTLLGYVPGIIHAVWLIAKR